MSLFVAFRGYIQYRQGGRHGHKSHPRGQGKLQDHLQAADIPNRQPLETRVPPRRGRTPRRLPQQARIQHLRDRRRLLRDTRRSRSAHRANRRAGLPGPLRLCRERTAARPPHLGHARHIHQALPERRHPLAGMHHLGRIPLRRQGHGTGRHRLLRQGPRDHPLQGRRHRGSRERRIRGTRHRLDNATHQGADMAHLGHPPRAPRRQHPVQLPGHPRRPLCGRHPQPPGGRHLPHLHRPAPNRRRAAALAARTQAARRQTPPGAQANQEIRKPRKLPPEPRQLHPLLTGVPPLRGAGLYSPCAARLTEPVVSALAGNHP